MCKFAITRKNDAFVAKIVNTCLTKIFMTIFAHHERLPSCATLPYPVLHSGDDHHDDVGDYGGEDGHLD